MRTIRLALIFFFLVAVAATVVVFNTTKPRVLIVQSYDTSYAWTRDVDIGIRRALQEHNDYTMRWFYMDTKRHPWSEYKVNEGKAVQKLVESWQPSVVIAVDDDAQEYALKHFVNRPDVKIVFAGVSDSLAHYGYDKADNATGILERKPYAALKESLLLIAGTESRTRPLRIMFVGDASESVRNDEIELHKTDWAPIEVMESHLAKTFDEWKAAIQYANQHEVDFIITANYRKLLRNDEGKELMRPEEVVAWTEANAKALVVGTNAFFVEDGGMLAIGTSPYEQGQVAISMVDQILHQGKATKDIPVQSTRQFVVAMRESGIRARKVKLPAVYEAAAQSSANFYP